MGPPESPGIRPGSHGAPLRVLVATYYFPPAPVNSARWVTMSRYLREFGVDATVLTTSAFGSAEVDRELKVVRTRDAAGSSLLRGFLRRGKAPTDREGTVVEKPPPRILTGTLVPDPLLVAWNPFALRAATRLHRTASFDCLVTSSPANSTHLLGLILRRSMPWLCDLRDPWRYEDLREPFPTRLQDRADDWLESRVLGQANAITAVQQATCFDLQRRRNRSAFHVPNGWDPEMRPEIVAQQSWLEPRTFRIVHTGGLSGAWGRNPEHFLEAFGDLYRRNGQVRLILAGRLSQVDLDLVRRHVPAEAVTTLGYIDRAQALALQRAADLLVVIGSERRSEFPGKTLEYLATDRPVLVLGEASEAGQTVRALGAGIAVNAMNRSGIRAALEAALAGQVPAGPTDLGPFAYPRPAEAMAYAIAQAIDDWKAGRNQFAR